MVRSATALLLTSISAVVPTLSSQSSLPPSGPTARFLSAAPEEFHYRAWRRLDAENPRFNQRGWLEATTRIDASGFHYDVIAEGGSSRVRKVLRDTLDAERELLRESGAASFTTDNYVMFDDGIDDGLARIRVTPRRRHRALVEGYLFVDPSSADLVELRGRLVKMPSFWTSRVDVVRRYARRGGVRVPIATESVAHLRLAGRSTFRMHYVYETINGRSVELDAVPAQFWSR